MFRTDRKFRFTKQSKAERTSTILTTIGLERGKRREREQKIKHRKSENVKCFAFEAIHACKCYSTHTQSTICSRVMCGTFVLHWCCFNQRRLRNARLNRTTQWTCFRHAMRQFPTRLHNKQYWTVSQRQREQKEIVSHSHVHTQTQTHADTPSFQPAERDSDTQPLNRISANKSLAVWTRARSRDEKNSSMFIRVCVRFFSYYVVSTHVAVLCACYHFYIRLRILASRLWDFNSISRSFGKAQFVNWFRLCKHF